MSGRFPALPNLEPNWFLVSVPVASAGVDRSSLVLLKSEEDGIAERQVKLGDLPGGQGTFLQLSNVFFRANEILHFDGFAAVA
jgi:hypothetical protein